MRTDFQKLRSNLCRRRCACVCVLRMQQCSPQVRPIRTFGMRAISAISPISQLQPRAAPCHGWRTPQGVRLNRVLGTSAPASGSAWGGSPPMLGRKAGCEGVRTDLSASLAMPRHRDIGPARFSPVDCEEALEHACEPIRTPSCHPHLR